MKFKMSEKSLFAMLLLCPWWISFLVATVLGFVATAPNPARVAQALQQRSAMTRPEFSDALQRAFVRQGYTVTRIATPTVDKRQDRLHWSFASAGSATSLGIGVLTDLKAQRQALAAHHSIYIGWRSDPKCAQVCAGARYSYAV